MNKIIIHIMLEKIQRNKKQEYQKINGKPLIQYSINHANSIKSKNIIVVSSDFQKNT